MTPDAHVALRDLKAIVASTGHHIVLIGAYARETTFDRVLDIPSLRTTRDVDAAVRVAGDVNAVDADVGGVVLPVAALCDLVAMKLFAFDDRADRTTKDLEDLEDLAFILEHASEVLHDRIFDEVDRGDLDVRPYTDYGPLLLGRDLRDRFGDDERERLAAIARRAAQRAPSLPGINRASSPERSDELIQQFAALEGGLVGTDG